MQASDKSRTLVASAVASVLALGFMAASQTAAAADMEKCAGVAAAGKNDCGTATSACAGTAKQDRLANTWILVPKGTCAKIAGGTVATDPLDRKGGAAGK
jgi:uncharacterized membrane protein